MTDEIASVESLVRKEVFELPPYNAGLTTEYVKQNYGVEDIAKLGSNENPFGISDRVQRAIAARLPSLGAYPDPGASSLKSILSDRLGVDENRIVLGNGSEDVIDVAYRACICPGDRVITVDPSFPLHDIFAESLGASLIKVKMDADLKIDEDALLEEIHLGCKILILSNPSNPVGSIVTQGGLLNLYHALPSDALLILDEAYFEYANGDSDYADSMGFLPVGGTTPFVVLRTFSKAYGLAGLRIGYGVTYNAEFASYIDRLRTPFNINQVAQIAAEVSVNDEEHLCKTITHNYAERSRMSERLNALGFLTSDSRANFVYFDCHTDSQLVAEKLLRRGVIVKPWLQSGYRNYIRVSVGSAADNDHFLAAIEAIRNW